MDIRYESLAEGHRRPVIDIFNHYIENGYAAFPEHRVPYEFFDMFLSMTRGYPAAAILSGANEVIGFGFLRAHNPLPAFKKTAELTCFLRHDMIRNGIGGRTLDYLESGARERSITILLAGISSLNGPSIAFHEKNGFTRCGAFAGIGTKFGTDFDVVWMQKNI
ncbi:MAG TPA: N-acetyltransferase family protein [Spirochaetota bacterium]|nr:N-acetyltransferase [Spirochaetota bacterium]HOD14996.1 N-acetyltransferase family protein [Spirochaetota bacterium]HPG49500.1 N-acetyltransferase family protein [Spirochaetota bacterium]HPN11529.1 N-acetyltransferase family protein [Spirochaetota bacterium]HQL82697.1 N-acetyltransferase family protein [Spirochaetota bacterium]